MNATITPPCARYRRAMLRRYKQVTDAQVYNCRKVAGSSEYSQHAWGNAVDIFAPETTMVKVARWSTGRLPWVFPRRRRVYMVIHDGKYWTILTRKWQPYTGSDPHTGHVHVDFVPHKTGIPPCAS